MILLDEPSMGLAPQIVEEIFEIVKDLNEKERVSFLLAEQNTNMALRYADYGYILENGRIVMDGEAKSLRENEDVKEFYLGVGGADRKSFRDVKSYRRRKRWLWHEREYSTTSSKCATRARSASSDAAAPRCPKQIAHAQTRGACLRARSSTASKPARHHEPRGAGEAARHAQVANCSTLQKDLRERPLRRLRGHPLRAAHGARLHVAPARSTNPKATARDYWRTARALYAAGFRGGELVHNCFTYHFTPAGAIMETRRARARLRRVPGRHRPDRAAGGGDRATCSPHGYVGTPSFLKIILEKADEKNVDICPR